MKKIVQIYSMADPVSIRFAESPQSNWDKKDFIQLEWFLIN